MRKPRDHPFPLLEKQKRDHRETTPSSKNETTLFPCYAFKNETTPKMQNETGTNNENKSSARERIMGGGLRF